MQVWPEIPILSTIAVSPFVVYCSFAPSKSPVNSRKIPCQHQKALCPGPRWASDWWASDGSFWLGEQQEEGDSEGLFSVVKSGATVVSRAAFMIFMHGFAVQTLETPWRCPSCEKAMNFLKMSSVILDPRPSAVEAPEEASLVQDMAWTSVLGALFGVCILYIVVDIHSIQN